MMYKTLGPHSLGKSIESKPTLPPVCLWGLRLRPHSLGKSIEWNLVVDWRDNEWCHDQKTFADYYFNFVGVKTFELQSFLHYYAFVKDEVSVVKKIRKPYIEDPAIDLYKKAFYLDEEQKMIQRVCDYEIEDFVVYSGVGFRGFAYSDFQHIHLAPGLSIAFVYQD